MQTYPFSIRQTLCILKRFSLTFLSPSRYTSQINFLKDQFLILLIALLNTIENCTLLNET